MNGYSLSNLFNDKKILYFIGAIIGGFALISFLSRNEPDEFGESYAENYMLGMMEEGEEHPSFSEEEVSQIVKDHLKKNRKHYTKNNPCHTFDMRTIEDGLKHKVRRNINGRNVHKGNNLLQKIELIKHKKYITDQDIHDLMLECMNFVSEARK